MSNNEFSARAERSAVNPDAPDIDTDVHLDRAAEQAELSARHSEIAAAFRMAEEQSDRYYANLRRMGGASTLINNIFKPYPCFSVSGGSMPTRISSSDNSSFAETERNILESVGYGEAEHYQIAPLDFGSVMAGYQPITELFLLSDTTIMRVAEKVNMGAPVNQTTFYSWPGGLNFYNNNPEAKEDMMNLIKNPRRITMVPVEAWEPKNAPAV